jgi:hypothetical protein
MRRRVRHTRRGRPSYIERLPAWQQAICREVRALVHAADPEVVETIKRGVQPYFVLQGTQIHLPHRVIGKGEQRSFPAVL